MHSTAKRDACNGPANFAALPPFFAKPGAISNSFPNASGYSTNRKNTNKVEDKRKLPDKPGVPPLSNRPGTPPAPKNKFFNWYAILNSLFSLVMLINTCIFVYFAILDESMSMLALALLCIVLAKLSLKHHPLSPRLARRLDKFIALIQSIFKWPT